MTYGIDVSQHQDPHKLPWNSFKGHVDFVIIRANYGTEPDRRTAEHVLRARDIGAKVGLYAFYRPTQDWGPQFDLFHKTIDNLCLVGDIAPVLDIEKDPFPKPGVEVSPAWDNPCKLYVERLVHEYGESMVYITQLEFNQLGKPAWVLHRPLWVAHYTSAVTPRVPGDSYSNVAIWQHRVAPFVPNGPGGYDKKCPELDQNRGLLPLPLIKHKGAPQAEEVSFDDELDRGILQCFDYTPLDES